MKRTLQIASNLRLPLDVVTRATGIVGQRGTGKTSTGVVLTEEAAACGAHFAVIDPTGAWWGLRSSADGEGSGLECVVFGGDHGDVALAEEHGSILADLVVDEGYNVVLDLSLLTKGAQVRFAGEFLEVLYHKNREALMLVMDEAHRFAPQSLQTYEKGGPAARCLGAATDVVTLGRRKGLGAVVISQRPAKINKDVFEQVEVVIAHRLMGPNDLKQISGWLQEADEEAAELAKSALEDLRKLPNGEALIYAPNLGDESIYGRYRIRPKGTYDSSKSPEIGVKVKEPKGRAEVDMAALETRMHDTLEKQRAEDPKLLQRQVRNLQAELKAVVPAREKVEAERDAAREEIEHLTRQLAERPEVEAVSELDREVLQSAVQELVAALEPFAPAGRVIASAPRAPRPEPPAPTPRPAAPAPAPAPEPIELNGDVQLKAGARRMLIALARMHARPLTRPEVGILSEITPGSGTMSDYVRSLIAAGLVHEDGGVLRLSAAGIAEVPEHEVGAGAPSPAELEAMWSPKFKAGARKMLAEVMKVYPDGLTRAELSDLTGISRGSGTMSDYVRSLLRKGVVVESGGVVKAHDAMFLGGS